MDQFKPQRRVFYLLLLCVFAVAGGNLASAAVDDNLRIRFTTTDAGGSYNEKHIHVVWLATTGGSFISTAGTNVGNRRAVWAKDRKDSLLTWWTSARQGDIDARTGATQTSYRSYDINWNFRRLNGTEIADGTYRLYFENTNSDDGTPRRYTYFANIIKGASSWSIGPITQGGYNNVSLDFTPGIIPAPTVTNSPATNITADSATLNGNVNLDSDVTIYWGETDGGTGTWDYQEDIVGTLAGNFSADISGLSPETTYHFRCYADNDNPPDGGTDWAGSSSSFVTASAVPVIDLSSESLDFGAVAVGFYTDLTFDIQNIGFGDDLIVESLEITGLSKSAFSIVSPSVPFNIASISGIQTVTVRFAPAVYAENYAAVSIGNDDPDLTIADVSLTGTGTMDTEVLLSALSGVGGICNAVVPVGSNLLVAQGAMLTILDASTPSALQLIGQVRLDNIIEDITVVGDTAYAAIGASGMQVVDVTNLSAPVALAAYDTPGHSYEVASTGSTLCVADGANCLLIYDISTPGVPLLQETLITSGSVTAVTISGTTVYVLNEQLGLQIVDLTELTDLQGHWKFDSDAHDSAASHDGTLRNGAAITNTAGEYHIGTGAVTLDGINDRVSTAYAGVLGSAARTTCAWFKCDGDIGDHQAIFNYGGASGAGNAWRIWLNRNDGSIINAIIGGNANSATTGLWDGQWHHVAVTFPAGGTLIGDIKIYVDGSEEITWYTNGDTQTVNTAAENTFEIGMDNGGTRFPFNGNIDDVRVYDRALDLSQIQSLYNASSNALDELELGQTLAVSGTTACVTDQLGNFFVVDVTDPAAPVLLGQTRVSAGNGTSIAISGDYAFVANASGVEVFDISILSEPNSVAAFSSTQASDIAIVGTTAYLAEKGFGLRALDISVPTSLAALGSYSFQTMPKAVAAGTSAAIIADDTAGMQVVGLTDPADPEAVSLTSTGALGYAQDVAVNGSLAYLANGLLGLQIVDLTVPSAPVLLGNYPTLGALSFASSVAVNGTTAMVADGRIVYVLDVSNSSSPSLVGEEWVSAGWAGGVAVEGSYGYVANGGMGIEVLNISDATSAGSLELPGVAYDIAVSGGIAYVAAGSAGLQILDVSTPASPSVITSFDTPGMALGITIVGSRVCVADKYSVAVIDVSTPTAPYLYAVSDIPVNSLGTDVVNSRLLVADGNAGIAILRAHAHPNSPLGDFNNSGKVTILDLAMLAGEWLEVETMLDVLAANLTDDTTTNLQDFAIMASNWDVGVELSAPTVDNAAATSITSNSARLNGEVTDNGLEDPTVTIYWGVTPGNLDNADIIGTQSSTFYDNISSLLAETTYYFRAYAENSAGGNWAESTASFDTLAVPDTIKINFQAGLLNSKFPDHPVTVTPDGYFGDIGEAYGDRGNGQTYGWNVDIQADARGNESWPDVRYDTLLHFAKGTPRTWEIALADGTYTIDLYCGDDSATDQTNSVSVEGVAFTDPDGDADTLGGGDFDQWLGVSVTVSDGKLTITAEEGPADNAKIQFIHITVE